MPHAWNADVSLRQVSRQFGFEEIDFPVLESEELYVRKAGEEITQQVDCKLLHDIAIISLSNTTAFFSFLYKKLYNFEDKGGRRVALRPELTPSLARLVLQKGCGLKKSSKWVFCIKIFRAVSSF